MDDGDDFFVAPPDSGGKESKGVFQNICGRTLDRGVGLVSQSGVWGKQKFTPGERPAFQGMALPQVVVPPVDPAVTLKEGAAKLLRFL